MTWDHSGECQPPYYGHYQVTWRFLWMPKKLYNTVTNKYEWRWGRWTKVRALFTGSLFWPVNYFEDVAWGDRDPTLKDCEVQLTLIRQRLCMDELALERGIQAFKENEHGGPGYYRRVGALEVVQKLLRML